MVRDQFITGLNHPYLIMHLNSNKNSISTSFQALDEAIQLLNKFELWKTNSQSATVPQTKNITFLDNKSQETHKKSTQETLKVC